ncbi:RNA polymerase sigma-70 factor [hydrothermal vent metagenome]|uniref:RNA polymerase sigma-70 factor n=1 Tax=hydrothermal vent metagenome TaxID=652676 RepID=A0A3B1DYW0_9ZZZZ
MGSKKEAFQEEIQQTTESSIHDARLVEDARQGNREAFGELVTRYEHRLLRIINRFVNDFELSRDLAQETFLRVYERLDQFDPARRFAPWMFQIGVNLTLDYLRRKKRRGRWKLFSEISVEIPLDPAVEDPRKIIDLNQEVRTVIEQLPEKYQTVLVLRDMENFSSSEIAAVLGLKEASVRWRLAEARKKFQKLWEARQKIINADKTPK